MENMRIARSGWLEEKKLKWGKPEDVITVEDGVVKFLYAPRNIVFMFFRSIFKKYAKKHPVQVYEYSLKLKDVLYSELILEKFYCFGDGATSISIKVTGFDKSKVSDFTKLVDENKSEEFKEAECFTKRGLRMWWNNLIYKQRDVLYIREERAFAKQYSLPIIPIPFFANGAMYASAVSYADIVFNDMNRGSFGKKGVFFGYLTSIFFNNLSSKDAVKIYKFVKERAVKLQGDGKVYKVCHFPKVWIKEQIQLNDDSIIYIYRKKSKTVTTYVSYKDLDMFYIAKSGFLKSQFFVTGEVSFQMDGSLFWFQSNPIKAKLKKILAEKLDDKAQLFRPSVFSGQRKNYSLLVARSGIIGKNYKDGAQLATYFERCTSFAVRPLWSLYNRELKLKGIVHEDLREKAQEDLAYGLSTQIENVKKTKNDEANEAIDSFWMPGIWFFWRRLCRALKRAGGSKASMRLKYWKKAQFDDLH